MLSLYDVEGTFNLDEDSRRVYDNPKFQSLLELSNEELLSRVRSVGVEPSSVSSLTAILLLMNTTSSWRVMAHADEESILSVTKSSLATDRRMEELRAALQDLGRSTLADSLPTSYPEDMYLAIIYNTRDVKSLRRLYRTSSVYARLLNRKDVLQRLEQLWRENEELMGDAENRISIHNFNDFYYWVRVNYYTSDCFVFKDKDKCFCEMLRRHDDEMWEKVKTMNYILSLSDASEIVYYGRSDIADYILRDFPNSLPEWPVSNDAAVALLIGFRTAQELEYAIRTFDDLDYG